MRPDERYRFTDNDDDASFPIEQAKKAINFIGLMLRELRKTTNHLGIRKQTYMEKGI